MYGDADAASSTDRSQRAPGAGQLPGQERGAKDGDRGRRPVRQLRVRDRRARPAVRDRGPAVDPGRGRRRSSPAAPPRPPACGPATGSSRSTASRSRASRSSRSWSGTARACRSAFTIERAGQKLDLPVTPRQTEITDRFGQVHRIGLIGVSRAGVEFQRSNPLLAMIEGGGETVHLIGGTLSALGEMIIGSRGHRGARRPVADRADVGRDRQGRRGAADLVHRRAVDQSRLDQPVPDSDAGWRPSAAVRRSRGCAAGRSTSAARRWPSASASRSC